jgi:hypothetical protein
VTHEPQALQRCRLLGGPRVWRSRRRRLWWYDYGIPSEDHAHLTRWTHNRKQADRATHKLEAQIAGDNEGRREISSVLSDGEYRVCITLGQPKPWPQHRPHYE